MFKQALFMNGVKCTVKTLNLLSRPLYACFECSVRHIGYLPEFSESRPNRKVVPDVPVVASCGHMFSPGVQQPITTEIPRKNRVKIAPG